MSLSRIAAASLVGGVLGVSAILAMRNAPAPFHPGIRRWYKRLAKPTYTPPDPVFGGVWPIVSTGFAIGGYRLLRQDPGACCGRTLARREIQPSCSGSRMRR